MGFQVSVARGLLLVLALGCEDLGEAWRAVGLLVSLDAVCHLCVNITRIDKEVYDIVKTGLGEVGCLARGRRGRGSGILLDSASLVSSLQSTSPITSRSLQGTVCGLQGCGFNL